MAVRPLNLLYWNCNSISSKDKISELELLATENKLDIICLAETKLSTRHSLKITGFTVYRKDRDRAGGGVAIAVNNQLEHNSIVIPTLRKLEAVAVEVHSHNHKMTLVSTYNPPQGQLDLRDINSLLHSNNKIIIMGDLNAKHTTWNCSTNNRNGITLLQHALANNYVIAAPAEPTYYPSRPNAKPSILDIALLKNISNVSEFKSLPILPSDHNPVIFSLNHNMTQLTPITTRNYKQANWKAFRDELDKHIPIAPVFRRSQDIDNFAEHLVQSINRATDVAIPLNQQKIVRRELPLIIKAKIKLRNRIRHQWQKQRDNNTLHSLRILTTHIKREINKWRNDEWNLFLSTLRPTDNCSLWRTSKYFKRRFSSIPPLDTPNGPAYTDDDKANTLADNFERIHKQNDHLSSRYHETKVNKTLDTFLESPRPQPADCQLTTPREIVQIIRQRNNKKSPGEDQIPNIVLKNLSKKCIIALTIFINHILMTSHFPQVWKTAKVLAFPKPGKYQGNVSSYRPISLLSNISKIIEKVILIRLNNHITENKILIQEQFGFRQHHSTTAQLSRLTEHITKKFNVNQHTGMLLLDIEKAFDTVWHNGLICKMIGYNFPKYLIHLTKSYLTDRTFFVSIKNKTSSKRPIAAGVPQGSLLGPTLFSLYINDIPRILNVLISIFADDTAIYTSSYRPGAIQRRLQVAINQLRRYFHKWKIKVNDAKTSAIFFTKRRPAVKPEVVINGRPLEWSRLIKYLGVYLDPQLTFTQHVNHKIQQAYAAMSLLYPLLNKNSKLCKTNKRLLYTMIIRPILTYAAPVWSSTCKSNFKKLQVVQNKCIRMIGNIPRFTRIPVIHNIFKLPLIFDFVFKLADKFYQSCAKNTTNSLIHNLGQYTILSLPFKRYKHKLPKHILLK